MKKAALVLTWVGMGIMVLFYAVMMILGLGVKGKNNLLYALFLIPICLSFLFGFLATKSLTDNAIINFRCDFHRLKEILGYDDKQLAKYLGCSESTIRKLRREPMNVSGKYILLVQAHLAQEDGKRWGGVLK